MRKSGIFILVFTLNIFCLKAQQWTSVTENDVQLRGNRTILPDNYKLALLQDDIMKEQLWQAPLESESNRNSNVNIDVMLSDGSIENFKVVEYYMMEEDLRKKFPEIKTFYGVSNSDSFKSIRIDYTYLGFRAVVNGQEGRHYIDHYQQNDKEYRIIYQKKDIKPNEDWNCEVEEDTRKLENAPSINYRAGDCNFRTYRLACAATGEYTAFHGGTVALGQASIVTAFNRVNQIFEQDVNARMILVGNNDQLIFTNANTDPYSNTNGSAMLGQNQTEVDGTIGSANYDIGHVFSTGGGGVAYLRSLCNEPGQNIKAGGVTGQGSPTGDPFWIDYVAHEVGHQFGANHTQNNSCQRNSATAMEPGSASTIMGYAGICSPNVQNNSDAYFHAISIQEMSAEVTSETCDNQPGGFSNNAPVVTALSNYTVPHSTPLVLEASATDSDFDALTYCWEQMDNEVATMPPLSTNTAGPAFRSLLPVSDNKRYLPSIDDIVNGTTDTWEVIPSVGRTMDWRVTVRDHALVPGCTVEADMTITVDGASGPFIVSSFNSGTTVMEGQIVTLNWDRANTNNAPVNCSNVDIFWSIDGGLTYPTTILSSTSNDGSEQITIPAGVTTEARIMVRGSNNVFFDINDANINVESGVPGYTMNLSPSSGVACQTDTEIFDVITGSINGFTTDINLSVTGNPTGSSIGISPNPVSPGNTSTITISNNNVATGNYNLTVTGDAGGMVKTEVFSLTVDALPVSPILISPSDGASNVSLNPTLSWNTALYADSYEFRIGTSPGGGNVVYTGSTSNTSIAPGSLTSSTVYYWSVRSFNSCGNSNWSMEQSFTTGIETCVTYMSTDVPKTIKQGPINEVFSEINVSESGTVTDLNIIGLDITHSFTADLKLGVLFPSDILEGFYFIQNECGSNDNINLNFDDEADTPFPCPMTGGGTYMPGNPLSNFDGLSINGKWQLLIQDEFMGDGGQLNAWGLEICYDPICELDVTSTNANGIGTLLDAIACAQPGETITLSNSIANSTIDLGSNQMLIDKNLTISADPADNIIVRYSGTGEALKVSNNADVILNGFEIEYNAIPRMENKENGKLTLNNFEFFQSQFKK